MNKLPGIGKRTLNDHKNIERNNIELLDEKEHEILNIKEGKIFFFLILYNCKHNKTAQKQFATYKVYNTMFITLPELYKYFEN